ncbi:DUF3781 domain-containing protein [Methanosphaera sp. ISO3-F5]|uniref:DUF3781 domain-containing protein n=1 Tax=Methanosphaera sp. ISO3-F5 TaxID=1452353 RepID=UPI002B25A9D5|nr:DUF3781 domain-containing protein [Methanosphaera sp. ISO3-F5]WQH65079.1 DUF3781 domain-containing protein [Methanosphaera sp. ISO3-F5]
MKDEILKNKEKIHTTELGIKRVKKNLLLKTDDVVMYCIKLIENENSVVVKKGKNYYINYDNIEITLNASSFTIITAHIKS